MRSDCPLNFGLELFGDKWTLLIIRDMMFFNKRYYNEFLLSREGISTNILADRLALLEREKFITKGKDKKHKQKLIYSLTEKGIDLLPLIIEVGLWSERYAGSELAPGREAILGGVRKDKSAGLEEMKNKLYSEHIGSQQTGTDPGIS